MKILKTEYIFSDDRLHGMRRRRISGEKLPKRLAAESVRYDGEKNAESRSLDAPKICFCRLRQLQGKRRMFPDRKGGCPPLPLKTVRRATGRPAGKH